jgi:Protein of unknown function (DUF3238)
MYIRTLEGLAQGATPLILCGTEMDDVDVKFRAFIPSPAVWVPAPGYYDVTGGDKRGYSYNQGTHRGEIHACVRLPSAGVRASLKILSRNWGQTTAYRASDSTTVSGFPKWYVALKPGATPAASATLQVTNSNLKIALGGTSLRHNAYAVTSKSTVLSLHADGSNPLISVAPAINADLNLYLKRGGDVLSCLVCGDHDGFPAYELYVNGVLIYCYDPIAAGKSPTALFPPSDIGVNTRWIDIQLVTGQIVTGQICKGSITQA